MSKELKSLQNVQVRANMLQDENSDLQSQLNVIRGELNNRLQEEEKKIANKTEDVVRTYIATYICNKMGKAVYMLHKCTGILVIYVCI